MHKILLITTNIGSLFGERIEIRNFWLNQISEAVEQKRPSFLAIHIQESGGKNYKIQSKEMVNLVSDLQMRLVNYGFTISRSFLDVQYEIVEEYTALSSLYFIHDSISNRVLQYNFKQRIFSNLYTEQQSTQKRLIIIASLVRSGLVTKEKFSRDFWPNFRFGRKGFLHTRWKISDRIFDMINVHLFHDESNLNFLENPGQYSNNRRNALNYILHKFEKFNGGTIEGKSNLFIFGDFNFRLDLAKLVKKLTMQTNEREIFMYSNSGNHKINKNLNSSSDSPYTSSSFGDESSEESLFSKTPSFSTEPSASSSCDDYDEVSPSDNLNFSMMRRKNSVIEYYKPIIREYLNPLDGTEGNVNWVLRIGRKRFEYNDPELLLKEWRIYAEDDYESKNFPLHEIQPEFAPTYPWNEETNKLMNTRAPAWCDRILFNENVYKQFIQNREQNHTYSSFGMEGCIGDHKPVLLVFELPS